MIIIPQSPRMNHIMIQIAGVSSFEDSARMISLGVDALGYTLRLPSGIHDGLTEEKARALIAQLPPFVPAVGITYITDAGEAIAFAQYMGIHTMQLHARVEEGMMRELKHALPYLKVIKSVNVVNEASIDEALEHAQEADALILDTYDPVTHRHGATGKTHDWAISAEIVRRCAKPVILAGGLTPDNVAEAISRVRPWGVDVHTGVEHPDGTKDWDKVRAFVQRVRQCS